MTAQDALDADRAGDLQLAAARYEALVARDDVSLDVVVNLAVLYWQATDPGMAAAKHLSPDFLATAGSRFPALLAEAERRFPGHTEPRFWSRYIAWTDLGGQPLTVDECLALLRDEPTSLVPAMHAFAASRGTMAKAEALELLRQCQAERTTRARYVASVIEGVMRRSAPRG